MKNSPYKPALITTILCGGAGSRLWPLSREQHPKPLIRLNGKQSLLQQAYLRGAALLDVDEILTVTNEGLFFRIEDEYQEISSQIKSPIKNHFILEPVGRNTAPALAYAALQVSETHSDDTVILVLTADHLILNQPAFETAVSKAYELALTGKIVTFGIQPTAPETGYGYIEANGADVIRFVEKPVREKAQEYLLSGKYLWNSGMFCFQAGTLLKEMATHCPVILDSARCCYENSKIAGTQDQQKVITLNSTLHQQLPDESIDYAIMEKTDKAAVVACDIGWSDIGCWRVLGNQQAPDNNSNRIEGGAIIVDSYNCTIQNRDNDRILGMVGVKDLVVVDTPDALLIADKERSQDVKQIYTQLKNQGHETHKVHRTVHRPWGTYTVLEEGPNFKIKRIEVKPGASLSLQMHHHRCEHWVVISGRAKVINGDVELILNINESTFIPATHKHRLENTGPETLVLIEVQTGHYLREDDIVRFDDVYGRAVCQV